MERPFHTPRRHVDATTDNDEHCDAIAFLAVCLRMFVSIERSVPSLKCFVHFRLFQLDFVETFPSLFFTSSRPCRSHLSSISTWRRFCADGALRDGEDGFIMLPDTYCMTAEKARDIVTNEMERSTCVCHAHSPHSVLSLMTIISMLNQQY